MTAPKTVREVEIKNFIHEYTKILTEYAKTEFGLPEKWMPHVTIEFSNRLKRSWGGRKNFMPYIKIAAYRFTKKETDTFKEYDHIKTDPVIGSLDLCHWTKVLACIVAHEIAHAVQHTATSAIPSIGREMFHYGRTRNERVGHGANWQYIYRKFRENFVNNYNLSTISYKVNPGTVLKFRKPRKEKFTTNSSVKGGMRFTHYYVNEKLIGCVACRAIKTNGLFIAYKRIDDTWQEFGRFDNGVKARNTLLRSYC